MSAYIVHPAHINALVSWAEGQHSPAVSYYWQGRHRPIAGDGDRIAAVLHAENVRSVNHRYAEHDPAHGHVYAPEGGRDRSAVEILKAIDGYEYQACECPDYAETEANAICTALRNAAIHRLPGYDAADWEITEARSDIPRLYRVGGRA